jgi:hypothetical protein
MAAVDFTGLLRINGAVPFAVTMGNVQSAPAGSFHTDRLGDRWGFEFTTPVVRLEPEGGRLQAMFDDAEKRGGIFPVEQPDFDVGAPGLPVIASDTASGKLVPLSGLTPGYPIRQRQWLSFVVDGQRYLDRVMEQVIADADGEATVRIKNLLRAPLTAGDTVELAPARIEGAVAFTSAPPWDLNRMTSFSFTVTESA